MATASEAAQVADEITWQDRVEYYRLKAGVAVMAEDAQTASHAERVAYAKAIIGGGNNIASYALAVAASATIQASIVVATGAPDWDVTDNDIEFTVNSLFNAFAGVAT